MVLAQSGKPNPPYGAQQLTAELPLVPEILNWPAGKGLPEL